MQPWLSSDYVVENRCSVDGSWWKFLSLFQDGLGPEAQKDQQISILSSKQNAFLTEKADRSLHILNHSRYM